jgi:transcriptional regulator
VLHPAEGRYGTLVAHTARADPIAKALDGRTELLAIFQGPSAYIRSRWYVDPGLPTYNFSAVHVYGRARPLPDRDATLGHLAELVDLHEATYADRFRLAEADEAYLTPLLDHIAPFTMVIEHIEGKMKLSQNRSVGDRAAVVGGLRERGAADDRSLAEAMQRYPYRSHEAKPLLGAPADEDRAPAAATTEPQPSPASSSHPEGGER